MLDRLTQPTTADVCVRVWRARHDLARVHGDPDAFTVYVDEWTWRSLHLEHGVERPAPGEARILGLPLGIDSRLRRQGDRPAVVLRAEVVA